MKSEEETETKTTATLAYGKTISCVQSVELLKYTKNLVEDGD